MRFSQVFKSNPISIFDLTLSSGGGNLIAFGAGSIINGNIKLFLDKPLLIKSLRVTFKCEEWDHKKQKEPFTLFSVESTIWKNQRQQEPMEMGNHIYLFAIQLPSSVNYPPTIKDAYLGHRIEYSLQGHLDLLDSSTKSTPIVPVTYLPLVTFDDNQQQQARSKTIQISDSVQVTAKLANPSCCPGDLCSVKLTTHNTSPHTITQVHIILLSTATSLDSPHGKGRKFPTATLPTTASGPSYHHKQRQLLNESFYVSIPKHTRDITTICPFRVPSFCVPTTQCNFGKYIDISYEVVIILGDYLSHFSAADKKAGGAVITHPHAIRLPLFITTVPPSKTTDGNRPPKLQIPFITAASVATTSITEENDKSQLPFFIETNESPLPSPTGGGGISPGGSAWSPGSPMAFTLTDDQDVDSDVAVHLPPVVIVTEDESGHLMVPTTTTTTAADRPNTRSRSSSKSS